MLHLRYTKFAALTLSILILAACSGSSAPADTAAEAEPTATPAAQSSDAGADAATDAAPAEDATAAGAVTDTASAGDAVSSDAVTDTATAGDTAAAPAGLRTFIIVPDQSNVSYHVQEEFLSRMLEKYGIAAGHSDTTGATQAIEGQLELDMGNLNAPLGASHFQVDLSTLTSDQSLRDRWLRSSSFIASAPTAEFTATGVEGAPASYTEGEEVNFQLNGDLTVNNVTQPVTFDVTAKLEGDTITGTATAPLTMTDFNVEPPNFIDTLTVQDDFQIVVDFVAQAQ